MILVGQQKRLSEPMQWGWRERSVVSGVLAVLIAVAVVLALTTGSTTHRGRCVEVTFASTLGAARIEQCGAKARALCAHPGRLPHLRAQVEVACRRAGLA
ncbi:MAG TPA: hypothetical protein VMA83_10525 [Solirubrobacteraceae bacterium]|nr:hypothetical protein [Solirubrobacteraceae bacterium]